MALTLDQLRSMMRVNKHRLDDELELQPEIMQRIAEQVVLRNSRMIEAKDSLAREEGRLTFDIARDAAHDGVKMTVDERNASVVRHKDRVRAFERLQAARAEYEEWNLALDCWRQKGFSLKELSNLYSAQYFSVNSTTDPGSRPALRDANYEAGRERLAERRSVPSGDAARVGMNERDAPRTTRRRVADE